MTFTKSLMLAGLQCEKQLWLRLHCPELAQLPGAARQLRALA
jgi:hypothetical protein